MWEVVQSTEYYYKLPPKDTEMGTLAALWRITVFFLSIIIMSSDLDLVPRVEVWVPGPGAEEIFPIRIVRIVSREILRSRNMLDNTRQ